MVVSLPDNACAAVLSDGDLHSLAAREKYVRTSSGTTSDARPGQAPHRLYPLYLPRDSINGWPSSLELE